MVIFFSFIKGVDFFYKFFINGIINWYNFKFKNVELVCGKRKYVFGVRCKLV